MTAPGEGLVLPGPLAAEMVSFCAASTPNEACGILALDGSTVARVFPMTNAAESPIRYALDPAEQLAVYRTLDDRGWELAAFHSHTSTDAYPSSSDVREALEDIPYVIVSLAVDPPEIRAFRIVKRDRLDETGKVVELPLTVTRSERSEVRMRQDR